MVLSETATAADFLATGLRLGPVDSAPQPVPPGTVCAISGAPLTEGYPVAAMVTDATSEFLEQFRGGIHGWVSESAARCYRSANPRDRHNGVANPCSRSNVVFADGTCWQPLIALPEARKQGRACWRELVREVWPSRRGERCLWVLTTDTKKRIWPAARVGVLGQRTPMMVYDPSGSNQGSVVWLDWPQLLACLDVVEAAYAVGFPKPAIRENLYSAYKIVTGAGYGAAKRLEDALAAWRGTPEFLVATLIAQRDEEDRS